MSDREEPDGLRREPRVADPVHRTAFPAANADGTILVDKVLRVLLARKVFRHGHDLPRVLDGIRHDPQVPEFHRLSMAYTREMQLRLICTPSSWNHHLIERRNERGHLSNPARFNHLAAASDAAVADGRTHDAGGFRVARFLLELAKRAGSRPCFSEIVSDRPAQSVHVE